MKLKDMFPDGDHEVVVSESGAAYLIDRPYRNAIRDAVAATADADGNLALTIHDHDDNGPLLVPTSSATPNPALAFPLVRIARDAHGTQRVERRRIDGDWGRDWTAANTLVNAGEEGGNDIGTRIAFIDYVRERAPYPAGTLLRRALAAADDTTRPRVGKGTLKVDAAE